jgi:hypothetical protein
LLIFISDHRKQAIGVAFCGGVEDSGRNTLLPRHRTPQTAENDNKKLHFRGESEEIKIPGTIGQQVWLLMCSGRIG